MFRHISTPGCALTARVGKSTLLKMSDVFTKAKRLEVMSRIRSRRNKGN
jgi:hypothetical protein